MAGWLAEENQTVPWLTYMLRPTVSPGCVILASTLVFPT